jgi:pimeloyl-ACP methyl ester carboxylesterase
LPFAHNGPVEIYYESFGDRADPVLLLVNGLGSQCISYDVQMCEMFVERHFFVVRFDNRDVGHSTKFDHFKPSIQAVITALKNGSEPDVAYHLADMADDALAVLDALGVERAHAVGMSMGGMIVQQLAIDHPERLASMTSIMSTTGDRDVGQSSPEVAALTFAPPGTDREGVIRSRQELERLFASPAFYDADRVARRAGDAFERSFNPHGVARQLAAIMASGSRTAALRDVSVPALVMHGDKDTLINISGGRRTAESIPGATFVSILGMGHDSPPALWAHWIELVSEHARSASIESHD